MNCLNCKTELNTGKKFCCISCQHSHSKKLKIKDWLNGKLTAQRGKTNIKKFVKEHLIDLYGEKCSLCAWNQRNSTSGKIPVELDHIDGDSTNNTLKNLRLLCPNCHSLTPTYKNLNKGKGRFERMIRYKSGKSY